ncbi:MAG: CinA family nicotinamide mononucleotide deamidase-related protein [Paludibacteraceae bacterium]|nr:CinA family nicotinamide mononucleotide deamidase-related protein [Paludibacteraceae bacterium]
MGKTMQAEIITIGDELLIGQVVDTNSAWMAERLFEEGITVKQITSVHDDAEHILKALDEAFQRADIVLTTGGLGPTKDDITKHVLCDYFGTRLIPNAQVEAHVRDLYKDRPDVLNRLTATQWLVPEACTVLENRVGSAPIMAFTKNSPFSTLHSQFLISMPGVPYEMKIAMTEQVLPWLAGLTGLTGLMGLAHRTLLVSGIAESSLAILLEDWETHLPKSLHLAYLPKDGIIRLRLDFQGTERECFETEWNKLKTFVNEYIVLDEDKPLELAVGELLKAKGMTISTAESCTGGKLAALLNKHSGSSCWYRGSVVAYDNSVKQNVLGVCEEDLKRYGAVSERVVKQMAEGARRLCGTDFAVATSGVAGPTGGTPDKPVGTVWIAWAGPNGTEAECYYLGKLREQITDRACTKALIKMLKNLQI